MEISAHCRCDPPPTHIFAAAQDELVHACVQFVLFRSIDGLLVRLNEHGD